MPLKKKKPAPKKKPASKKPAKKPTKAKPAKKPALKKSAAKPKPKAATKSKPAAKPKKTAKKRAESGVIGKITHYFPHVNAAVVVLKAPLKTGDFIRVKGHTTDFAESVNSMQINHKPITEAKKGDEIGLQVGSRVRAGDKLYKA